MLQSWMAANKLTINPHKSQIIVIYPKIRTVIPKFSLSYGDTLIYAVKTTKYLGIEIDDQLNFLPYTQKLQKKLSRNVGVLTKLKHCLPKSALIALYYGIVFPHLLYGIIIWGSTYPTYLKKLQTIQNKAIRAISDSGWNVHVTPLYYEHKILKVNDIYKLNLPNLCTNTSTKNFPIIFKTTSIKFLEIMATPLELQLMMTSLFHFSGLIVAKNHSSIKDQNYGILFPKI